MPTDKYSNKAYIAITMSGANVLTFEQLQTGVSLFDKVGWLINRLEWYLDNASVAELTGAADQAILALTLSNSMDTLDLSDAAVVDLLKYDVAVQGGTGVELVQGPIVREFGNMPGGGLLVPPRPLYIAMDTSDFVAAGAAALRFHFTQVTLKPEEYWELVEAYRLVE